MFVEEKIRNMPIAMSAASDSRHPRLCRGIGAKEVGMCSPPDRFQAGAPWSFTIAGHCSDGSPPLLLFASQLPGLKPQP